MFRAVKCKNPKTVMIIFACLLLLAAVCFFALRTGTPDTITIRGEEFSLKAEDETEIKAFLAACGYESPALQFERVLIIPKHWNDVYTAYNELQRRQGFDLVPYKGKGAAEYVYFVPEGRNITVLTSGGRIIAAHICSCDGSECAVLPDIDERN